MKRIVSLTGEEIQKLSKYSKDFHVALGIVLALLEKQEPIKIKKSDDIPEGYELVGEVDIPDSMLKKEMQIVPAKLVTDEDLKQRNQIAKEIIGIKGRQLFIEKQNGDAWQYTVRNEVTDDILAKLEERQTEGWKPLGMAIFETSPNSPLLKLVQIGL